MPSLVSQQIPFSLPPGTQTTLWNNVSTGDRGTYGITENNYLFTWGLGTSGQLGDGTSLSRSSPVQIGASYTEDSLVAYAVATGITLNSWTQIASAISTMAGVTSDGSLFTWGIGSQGELGTGDIIGTVSYPTKLGTSSWSSVCAGVTHFAAIRSDGKLFAWGNNASGQLGDGTLVHRSSPVQIGSNSYIHVNAGASNTAAIDNAYTLWTWGNNNIGQLGTNDLFNRSAPVQIGISTASGYYSNYFNGTTSYLTLPAGTLDYVHQGAISNTIECWVYTTSTAQQTIVSTNAASVSVGFTLTINNNLPGDVDFQIYRASSGNFAKWNTAGSLFSINQWVHIAVTFTTGTSTLVIYVNGVSYPLTFSGTIGYSAATATYVPSIGRYQAATPAGYLSGFISNLRLTKEIVYSSNFTPSTTPLTTTSQGVTSSNVTLLTCQNETFADNSINNYVLTDFGNPGTNLYYLPFNNSNFTNTGPSWTTITTGVTNIVATTSAGTLFVWGSAASGQLGQGLLIHRSSPVQISTFAGNEQQIDSYVSAIGYSGVAYTSWTKVASATNYNLAIRNDGRLFAWGNNSDGALGIGNIISKSGPTEIGTSSWSQVFANDGSTFAIRSDGALFAWGINTSGSLGLNDTVSRSSPVQLGTSSWVSVASGGTNATGLYALATRSDGALFVWGLNNTGQLGDSTIISRSSPIQLGTSSWSSVAAGTLFTAAIRSDGGLFTWGSNTNGELGSNVRTHRSSPVQLGTGSWSSIATGSNHMLAITSSNGLFTWGIGPGGALGSGLATARSSPVQVGTSSWISVGAGATWSFAIRNDSALFAWGVNTNGNLGLGDLVSRSSPVQVGTSSWVAITSSAYNSVPMAIRSDNRLFAWGYQSGAGTYSLGNYRFNITSSPVVITTFTESYSSAGIGTNNAAAVRQDGILFTWGAGLNGLIGDGTAISKSAPTQVGTSYWNNVSVGGSHIVALNSSNNLFAWGLNSTGQLGDNSLINRSSPVQIGSSTYAEIETSVNSSYAKKQNYSLYGWGTNSNQFGTMGLRGNQSAPALIGIPPDSWTSVASMTSSAAAFGVRSDKSLFTWGLGTSGQLGSNVTLSKSNPTQLGGGIPIGYYSNYFDGSGDYLRVPNNSAFQFGAGNFTVEFWIYATSLPPSGNFPGIVSLRTSNTAQHSWSIYISSVDFGLYMTLSSTGGATTDVVNVIPAISPGVWYHAAICRSGNTVYTAVNGTVSSTSYAGTLFASTAPLVIGRLDASIAGNYFKGYVSNLRIVKGTAVYTSNFTPPTSPLTAITNTSLLTCQGLGFSDNSINNFSITVNGNTLLSTVYPSSFSVPPGGTITKGWVSAAGGTTFGSAITDTYELYTWGENAAGQLGLEVGLSPAGSWLIARSSPVQVGTVAYAASPIQVGSSSWTTVSSGTKHVLATRTDGTLFAWGLNSSGQLGDNTLVHRSSPIQVGTSSWGQVSAGANHSVAIAGDNTLYAWGLNSTYQIGDNSQIHRSSPVQISTSSWSQVSAGYSHSLAIRADNTLWGWGGPAANEFATYSWKQVVGGGNFGIGLRNDGIIFTWGSNGSGQLGVSDIINRSSPVQVGTSSWSVISAGIGATAAIRIDGSLFMWGSGANGQLGLGDINIHRSSPVQVGTSSWLSVMNTINNTTYAIRNDNSLFAWGNSSASFPIGDNNTVARSSPVQIGSSSWTQVTGSLAIAAIRSDGALFMWNGGGGGVQGNNATTALVAPAMVSSLNTENDVLSYAASNGIPLYSWSQIASGLSHTVLLRSDSKLFVFGSSSSGQLGDNSTTNKFFVQQLGNDSWISVAAGGFASAAVRSDGLLFTWGDNSIGALGLNNLVHRSSPVQVGTTIWSNVYMAGASGSNIVTFAIRADRALFAWGYNVNGVLGLSDTISRSSPVQVGASSWSMIAGSNTSSMGIRIDGALFGWGANLDGTIGDNTRVNKSSPVQIGTSSWTKVAASATSTAAIKFDGTLYTWGLNSIGQLGLNDRINRSSPTQVGTGSWTTVSVAPSFMAAVDSNNKLFAWGFNNNGQLGQQDLIHRSSPTQIGTSNWTNVSLGDTSLIASRSDNLLFGVGQNNNGQLGTIKISPTSYSSPVVVMTVTDSWAQVSVGGSAAAELSALGLRNDKLLFTWGANSSGQLGLGDTVHRSAPVQLGAQSWNLVSVQSSHILALDTSNKLYVWGNNTNGQLGFGDQIHRSSPVQLGTSTWTNLLYGTTSSTSAVNAEGILFTWGNNSGGSLGLNNTVHRSSPVQLGSIEGYVRNPQNYSTITQIGNSGWNSVSAGNNYSMAVRISDNVLFTWGFNSAAPLRGTLTNIGYSAAQVSSGTSHFGFVKKP